MITATPRGSSIVSNVDALSESWNIAIPVHEKNDLLLIDFIVRPRNSDPAAINGWQVLDTLDHTNPDGNFDGTLVTLWKTASSTETSVTAQLFSMSANAIGGGIARAWDGVIDSAVAVKTTEWAWVETSGTMPSITTIADGSAVEIGICVPNFARHVNVTTGTTQNGKLFRDGVGNTPSGAVGYIEKPTAGAVVGSSWAFYEAPGTGSPGAAAQSPGIAKIRVIKPQTAPSVTIAGSGFLDDPRFTDVISTTLSVSKTALAIAESATMTYTVVDDQSAPLASLNVTSVQISGAAVTLVSNDAYTNASGEFSIVVIGAASGAATVGATLEGGIATKQNANFSVNVLVATANRAAESTGRLPSRQREGQG